MRPIDADAILDGQELYSCEELADFVNLLRNAPTITQPPNDHLTLSELREMDGEPVWCAFSEGRDCNMIIQWHNSEFFRSFECGFLLAEEYGKSWQAYRRKPEEGTV